MEPIVFLNGEMIPEAEAKVSPLDYGYLYGYGLFETMRAYQGKIFRLQKHLKRLYNDAQLIGIELSTYNLETAISDVIEANKLTDARVRLTITKGKGEITPDPASCKTPTVFIIAQQYTPLPERVYFEGCIVILSRYKRSSISALSGIKSANYLINILAKTEAKASGAYEALLLNEKGFISEASMSNIFIVHKNNLLTPPVESGILPGITRAAVLEIAVNLGIKAYERDISLKLLEEAEEIFLTNSILEILPVHRIDSKTVVSVKKAMITNRIREAYKQLVSMELKLI
ncbi:MAG: aminotransferase class IV [Chloroflexi bacterium]|nr:aminotransferase class IV [Chloroflexota bacterium]